jgi:hypothetical protein
VVVVVVVGWKRGVNRSGPDGERRIVYTASNSATSFTQGKNKEAKGDELQPRADELSAIHTHD